MKNPCNKVLVIILMTSLSLAGCKTEKKEIPAAQTKRMPVIFDTDANNELDDQHALAYLFYNQDIFDIAGITVNTTRGGGNIDMQYAEAERIMKLCAIDSIPLIKGADKSYSAISPTVDSTGYDGQEAVDFITKSVNDNLDGKMTIIAVGKLTTIAIALQKEPGLAEKIRLVWLGSNYPATGEYNLENDTVAANYILKTNIEFEMVVVRYGEPTGTAAVKLSKQDAIDKLSGVGPVISPAVTGRHGGEFTRFGDYLVNLFEHIEFDSKEQTRALYDMAAVAIVKNPKWAESKTIPGPLMVNNAWVDRPENPRKIKVWENFDKDAIIKDFLKSVKGKQ
ncbi:MAG: nucleoside hydrolase [Chryseolinea sp.]